MESNYTEEIGMKQYSQWAQSFIDQVQTGIFQSSLFLVDVEIQGECDRWDRGVVQLCEMTEL